MFSTTPGPLILRDVTAPIPSNIVDIHHESEISCSYGFSIFTQSIYELYKTGIVHLRNCICMMENTV